MIIVRLIGGLGNQLFQYAAGRAIACRKNVLLKLDITAYDHYPPYLTKREYRLRHFNIVASIASPEEIAALTGKDKRGLRRQAHRFVQSLLPYYRRSVFRERSLCYDANIWKVPPRVYLMGYWASEKYFKEIEHLLRPELMVKHPQTPENQALSSLIQQTESVSLHVRRSDFVSNPKIRRRHGACTLEYYQSAIKWMTQTVKHPHFFIFSDDIAWVKENLYLDYPTKHVIHNGPERDYEDLRLMSQCKHHIIANSTFSWWGAWLSTNPDKIVVAPKKWASDEILEAKDLIPDKWMQL